MDTKAAQKQLVALITQHLSESIPVTRILTYKPDKNGSVTGKFESLNRVFNFVFSGNDVRYKPAMNADSALFSEYFLERFDAAPAAPRGTRALPKCTSKSYSCKGNVGVRCLPLTQNCRMGTDAIGRERLGKIKKLSSDLADATMFDLEPNTTNQKKLVDLEKSQAKIVEKRMALAVENRAKREPKKLAKAEAESVKSTKTTKPKEENDEALLKRLKQNDSNFVEKWGTVDDEIPTPEAGAKILNSDAPPPTPKQVANIQEYTGENYSYINESLRDTGRYDESEFDESGGKEYWQEKGKDITNALDSIPNKYEGVVYRGTSLPKELLAKMEVGGTYADKGLMSTTKNLGITKTFGSTSEDYQKTVFVIKSQTGVDVSKVSANKGEDEILFGAGKQFAINKMQMAGGILYIGLKEK